MAGNGFKKDSDGGERSDGSPSSVSAPLLAPDSKGDHASPSSLLATGCGIPSEAAHRPITIGVLALQGAVEKHVLMLDRCGVSTHCIRFREELDQVDGLIIPGGESTTVGKLMDRYGIDSKIIERANQGMPVFGTCTGMILLAKEIEASSQHRLGLIDCTVRRNAFGRQVDSFEADLEVSSIGEPPFRSVFIRAPFALRVGADVEVLASFDGKTVMCRQQNILASAFHPELTDDTRIHECFVEMVRCHVRASTSGKQE